MLRMPEVIEDDQTSLVFEQLPQMVCGFLGGRYIDVGGRAAQCPCSNTDCSWYIALGTNVQPDNTVAESAADHTIPCQFGGKDRLSNPRHPAQSDRSLRRNDGVGLIQISQQQFTQVVQVLRLRLEMTWAVRHRRQ